MERAYITCRELIDFIADYVAGELDAAARDDFERHLAVCPSCRAYLDSYRKTMALTRALASDEPAEDVPEELVRRILDARR
ncbi:MAG TPA: zf-HC2 domain-containing protein [Thermoanaerobaculia bacterium]|nr:zf-HC2 domain-containing protein [Thermoanaerobaculia bacterium]